VNAAPSIRVVAPVVVLGVLIASAGSITGSPALTMFLAIVAGVCVACCGGSLDGGPLLAVLARAAIQSVVLTGAVVLSGSVALPAPLVWLVLCLATASGGVTGLILSALCAEASTTIAWLPLLLVPQVILGGFLVPYYPTQPFAVASGSGQVEVMPRSLVPPAASGWPLQLAGAVVVSRWALEGYAALVYERDLSQPAALAEAVKVNASVPVLLGDDVAHPIWLHVRARSRGEPTTPPRLHGGSRAYLAVLLGFVAVPAAALWGLRSSSPRTGW
jgi:hypothetical protein